MNEIVSSQALLFITSIEIGIILGMVFDIIRVTRKIVKIPDVLVQIEDLLYWIICGLVGFYILYITNYAEIRPFVFVGMVLGAIFYFATFSIVFMKAATAVINYVKALLKRLWQLFLIPVRWCIKTIKRPIRYMDKQIAIKKEKQYIWVHKRRRIKYQQAADAQTQKLVDAKFKKINLEEKQKQREADRLKKEANKQVALHQKEVTKQEKLHQKEVSKQVKVHEKEMNKQEKALKKVTESKNNDQKIAK